MYGAPPLAPLLVHLYSRTGLLLFDGLRVIDLLNSCGLRAYTTSEWMFFKGRVTSHCWIWSLTWVRPLTTARDPCAVTFKAPSPYLSRRSSFRLHSLVVYLWTLANFPCMIPTSQEPLQRWRQFPVPHT